MPIIDITARGIRVIVITTILIVPGMGISISSGYPISRITIIVSIAFLGSSIPPSSLPESV